MAIDGHVVGRVGEDHLRPLTVHQGRDRGAVERAAADQPMRTKLPKVADAAAHRSRGRDHVLFGRSRVLRLEPFDEAVDLGDRETGDADIEVEIKGEQILKLPRQDLFVPASVERELIVGDDVGALLGGAHRLDAQAGHPREAEYLGGFDAAVAGKNGVVGIDEDGVREAKALDRRCDLANLLFRVSARVPLPGVERARGVPLDLHGNAATATALR
jgi:hypothetical protein